MPNVVRVGDVAYCLEGRLARGESSDVFLGRRARRVTERVVLKVLRARANGDLLEREHATLRALQTSTAPGTPYFSRTIPEVVQKGHLRDDDGTERPTLILRHLSGFSPTLADVREAYPRGVDPRAAVWMWRRALETLGWVHDSGWVHGAVVPQHLVVHPRDHGALLVGWSCAGRPSEAPIARVADRGDFYPAASSANATDALRPELDLVMSARCIAFVLGGDARTGEVPSSVPAQLAALVREHSSGAPGDARALHEALGAAAKSAFGPPAYHAFVMPDPKP